MLKARKMQRYVILTILMLLGVVGCVHQSPRPATELSADLTGEWFWEHPGGSAQLYLYLARSDASEARYSGQFCYIGQQGARINCARQDNLWQRPAESDSAHLLFEFINPYDGKLGVFRLQRNQPSQLHWQLLSATEWLPLRVDLQRQ